MITIFMAACLPSFQLYSMENFLGQPASVLEKQLQAGHTHEEVDILDKDMRKA